MACTTNKMPLLRAIASRNFAAQAKPKSVCRSEVQCTTLPNKLVVATTDSALPVARVAIVFRVGSRNETYDNLGAAHMLHIAAGLTNKNSTAFGVTRQIQQIGGNLSVTATRETIAYNVELTTPNLETGLKYLQDVATAQVFKPWELTDSLSRLKGDLHRIPDDVRAVDLLHIAAFKRGLGNSMWCPKHMIGKLSSETMQHFTSSYLTTNRCAVIGVGVDQSLLVGYAQNLGLESGEGNDLASVYQGAGEIRWDKSTDKASVAIAGQGCSLANQNEALAFAVLQCAVGVGSPIKRGGTNGAIGKAVACTLGGSSYEFSSLNASYTDNGLFGFVLTADGQKIGKAIDAAVKTLKAGNVSCEDITRGKAQLKAAILMQLESSSSTLDVLSNQAVLLGKAMDGASLAAAIDAVSAADVNAAAKKIACSKLSIGAVGYLAQVPSVNQIN